MGYCFSHVARVSLNGERVYNFTITYNNLMMGGELVFEMSSSAK